MTSKHLSDYDIQQFLLDEASCDQNIIQHARMCPSCNSKAQTYRLIFASLEEQPKPVFEFDLTRSVLAKLPKAETFPSSNALIFPTAATIVAVIAALSYMFGLDFLDIFSSVSSISLYIIGAASLTFLAFQIIDILKKHKKQMTDLKLGETTATIMGHSGHIKNTTLN